MQNNGTFPDIGRYKDLCEVALLKMMCKHAFSVFDFPERLCFLEQGWENYGSPDVVQLKLTAVPICITEVRNAWRRNRATSERKAMSAELASDTKWEQLGCFLSMTEI